MANKNLTVDKSWLTFFEQEMQKLYFTQLLNNIKQEYENYTCYPDWEEIFQAFKVTVFFEIKVVILGQDPYHQPHQAHGLAFSVKSNTSLPPSLKNIFTELKNDLNIEKGANGDLTDWAKQGVLLLNTTLTVRKNQPNSHLHFQWNIFTDSVITFLSLNCKNLVFILWGKNARNKKTLIDSNNHFIIESVHPSPLSAYGGFFNSKPFSKTNKWLITKNKKLIQW